MVSADPLGEAMKLICRGEVVGVVDMGDISGAFPVVVGAVISPSRGGSTSEGLRLALGISSAGVAVNKSVRALASFVGVQAGGNFIHTQWSI